MTYSSTIQTTFTIVRLAIAVWLFSRTLPVRSHAVARVALVLLGVAGASAAAISLGYSIFPTLTDDPTSLVTAVLSFVAVLAAALVAQMLIWRSPIWTSVYCCSMAYALENLAGATERIIASLLPAYESYPPPLLEATLRFWAVTCVVYALAYWLLIRRIRKTGLLQIDDPIMVVAALLAVAVNMVLDLIVKDIGLYEIPDYYSPVLFVVYVLICVYIMYSAYEVVYTRRLQLSMAALERLRASEARQYEMSRENIEAINLKCHDIKHQIRTLADGGAVVDGRVLESLEHEVDVYDSAVRCGNDALDTILTEKSLVCERRGITLGVIADGSALDFMDAADLYSLFGNALDNAIEAVSKLDDPELRAISLDVRRAGDMVAIHVENFFDGELSVGDDGLPLTSKGDSRNHGFGTRSMRMVVESYGGSLSVVARGDVFALDALVPMP